MATRTSCRQHRVVDYNENAAGSSGGAPAWARQIEVPEAEAANQKENSRPAAPKHIAQRNSAPAVASKGRNAGLTRLPIEDAKAGSKPGSDKARSSKDLLPKAAGKQVLPGVMVKTGPAGAGAGPAAQPKPASKSAGSTGRGSSSGGSEGAAASAKPGLGSGKRKAAAAAEDAGRPAAKPAAKSAPAAAATAAPEAKRQKAAAPQPATAAQPAAAQLELQGGAAGAAVATGGDAQLPGSGAEELLEQYATNFRELQAEYAKLQTLYEDLKAAKIDEEVAQLLEQQNKYVTEHGQKAAQLVEHYKAEAEHHAVTAAELGGGALVEQCAKVQADLINCQQALVDKESESLEKSKRMAEMQARLSFLERFARTYKSCDKCIQTDPPPRASASVQFPSLQSSGVEMLQAHAMVPEGAGAGSVYKRPKAGIPPANDPSYTLPGLTPVPAGPNAEAGTAAEEAAVAGNSPLAAAAAAGGAPISGSDMQLTGGDESAPQEQGAEERAPLQQRPAAQPQQPAQRQDQQQQQPAQRQDQQQQQRWHSCQPVAARITHAAARPALRPASAESQVHPTPAVGADGSRRVSAPPPPLDRQLHFSASAPSLSTGGGASGAQGPRPLPAVPEEEQPASEAAAPQQMSPLQPPAAPVTAAPMASQATAAGAAAPGAAARTPGSVAPRELAITALTGLVSTPLRGGFYEFSHNRHGFVFQLGPCSGEPDSADLPGNGERPLLCYRVISLGTAASLLPDYLKDTRDIYFSESERCNFVTHLLDALAQKPLEKHRQL